MTTQIFAYERKENSAVIWRCFSHDIRAEVPEVIDGLPVKEIAPYAFSAHMDEKALERGIRDGKIRICVPEVLQMHRASDTVPDAAGPAPVTGQSADDKTADMEALPPALCGNRLEEVVFPAEITRVGRYCFYNCDSLDTLEFNSRLADWGSGVFTGCHKIKKLRIHVPGNEPSFMKTVLDELREELMVEYYPEGMGETVQTLSGQEEQSAPSEKPGAVKCAHLVFPEFYEEGIENTPARILEEKVHGTGVHYRNCFKGREFDFRQYDSLFPYAIIQESRETVGEMAMGRLRYPYCLSDPAKEQYLQYVQGHAEAVSELLMKRRDMDGIRWLLSAAGENTALCDYITERASALHFPEALSYLMEFRRASARPVRRHREL